MPSKSPSSTSASPTAPASSSVGITDADSTPSRKRSSAKKARATPAVRRPAAHVAPAQPRVEMRRSEVHGNGVFAAQDLKADEVVMEYTGEVISWKEALRRHPHDPAQPNHTFYFHIDDKHVIDGKVNGNDAKWINHSCDPNCEADEEGGRIFIRALRDIAAGQELNYDYGLVIDEPYTPELLADFPCWCGSDNCRGTLLSPNDDGDVPGKDSQKKSKKSKAKSTKKAKTGAKKDKAEPKSAAKKSKPDASVQVEKAGKKSAKMPAQNSDEKAAGKAKTKAEAKTKAKGKVKVKSSAQVAPEAKAGKKASVKKQIAVANEKPTRKKATKSRKAQPQNAA